VGSGRGEWVGFQVLVAVGTGIIYSGTIFPVLAALDVEDTANALAFYNFLRSFAQTWGITISGTILQNTLSTHLPPSFTSSLFSLSAPSGSGALTTTTNLTPAQIAYASIPLIPSLPLPVRIKVQEAFAASLSVVWKVMIGFSVLGLLSVGGMREVGMHVVNDARFVLEEGKEGKIGGAGVEKGIMDLEGMKNENKSGEVTSPMGVEDIELDTFGTLVRQQSNGKRRSTRRSLILEAASAAATGRLSMESQQSRRMSVDVGPRISMIIEQGRDRGGAMEEEDVPPTPIGKV